MKKLIEIVILLIVIYGAYSFWYARSLQPAEDRSEKRVTVSISSGWSVSRIAGELESEGIIRSDHAFKKYVSKNDLDASLKAGDYVLSPGMTMPEIAKALTEGLSSEARITIPEGYTIAQIDALLAEKGLGKPGDFLRCAYTCDFSDFSSFLPNDQIGDEDDGYGSIPEGYAFPDTYFFSRNDYSPQSAMHLMLRTFRQRVIDQYGDEVAKSGRTLHEIVIMGSLIEKETRADDERAVVSGILWKRLDASMGLDVDATIRYAVGNATDPLTRSQLNIDSPYNTRRYRGLPVGPIANAGLTSIEAALKPEDSPYWYYLHGNDGQIRYAETNEEHNINKARYLR